MGRVRRIAPAALRHRRYVVVLALLGTLLQVAAAPTSATKPGEPKGSAARVVGTTEHYSAPFAYARYLPDWERDPEHSQSTCQDGGGQLVCEVAAGAEPTGEFTASAALVPADGVSASNPGAAWAMGWAGAMVHLPPGLTRIDVTATFHVDSATATAGLGSGSAVDASAAARFTKCKFCASPSTSVRFVHAIAGSTISTSDRAVSVVLRIVPPSGQTSLPSGWMSLFGSLSVVTNTVEPLFVGRSSASVAGRLTGFTVHYVG